MTYCLENLLSLCQRIDMDAEIQNPGSAVGEAIGAAMEKVVNLFLSRLIEPLGYHFISQNFERNRPGKNKKLLMYDKFGTAYNIDAVIANESMQPLILIESKYIRYKKHNRDKGSWICTAHSSLMHRYQSIRSSIAVLGGNWSQASLTMIKSYDINIFLIPFQNIALVLSTYGIVFDWDEKDRNAANEALNKYLLLTDQEKESLGMEIIQPVCQDLQRLVLSILSDQAERGIKKITIELRSNLGETKNFEFISIDEAIAFLSELDVNQVFLNTGILTLFDPPPDFENT